MERNGKNRKETEKEGKESRGKETQQMADLDGQSHMLGTQNNTCVISHTANTARDGTVR